MQTPRDLRDMNEADRSKKLAELKALKEKKLSEILTPEQINSLNAYYAEMGKNMQQKREIKGN
jgi:Spy/CpxP family protein refolding chaperone